MLGPTGLVISLAKGAEAEAAGGCKGQLVLGLRVFVAVFRVRKEAGP